MRVSERHKLSDIQHLVGRAKGVYMNDRDPNAADKIIPDLETGDEALTPLQGGSK